MPATTPYRRPAGSLRAKTSKLQRRCAEPSPSAAESIVSSYWSVSSAVLVFGWDQSEALFVTRPPYESRTCDARACPSCVRRFSLS
ncbi:hypothetical protein [Rhodococcus sp. MTM3W5.2]|uniref:hypothetical protein n=1 Tax=Rhodococcus sp. MTM3W5.2 TaxID=1805827 RepID=UPI001CB8D361|nr:hypothetical protein [Rhodococcus sp. MTM3W5.2]